MTRGQSRFRKAWNVLMGIEPQIEKSVNALVDQNPTVAMDVIGMHRGNSIKSSFKELLQYAPKEIRGELSLKLFNELKDESNFRRKTFTRQNIFNKNRALIKNAAGRKTKKESLKIVKSILKWAIMYAVLYASFYQLQSALSTNGAIDAIAAKVQDLNNMRNALKQQQNTWMGYTTSWFKKGGIESMSFLLGLANILLVILGVLLDKGVNIATALSLVCTSIILVVRVATENRSFSWLGIKNTSITRKSKSPPPTAPPITITNVTPPRRVSNRNLSNKMLNGPSSRALTRK